MVRVLYILFVILNFMLLSTKIWNIHTQLCKSHTYNMIDGFIIRSSDKIFLLSYPNFKPQVARPLKPLLHKNTTKILFKLYQFKILKNFPVHNYSLWQTSRQTTWKIKKERLSETLNVESFLFTNFSLPSPRLMSTLIPNSLFLFLSRVSFG